ncbi:hypothetical protein CYMTET_34170 [Cymbomonas tetramitiformis]|uniref:Uncharacterized protein n=1 Tax=Cymbomonas tetramitiformis TaxID=36881 RepID=A0AAE0FBT2_9CHLO|nr:hypothetical protein CYMTET_34170 [Cymbomonas tetramitiformis]
MSEIMLNLRAANSLAQAVAFVKLLNSNHLLISGSADRTLRVWDTVTRQQTQILRGHNAEVTALATSSQIADAVLSGDKDGHRENPILCSHLKILTNICQRLSGQPTE